MLEHVFKKQGFWCLEIKLGSLLEKSDSKNVEWMSLGYLTAENRLKTFTKSFFICQARTLLCTSLCIGCPFSNDSLTKSCWRMKRGKASSHIWLVLTCLAGLNCIMLLLLRTSIKSLTGQFNEFKRTKPRKHNNWKPHNAWKNKANSKHTNNTKRTSSLTLGASGISRITPEMLKARKKPPKHLRKPWKSIWSAFIVTRYVKLCKMGSLTSLAKVIILKLRYHVFWRPKRLKEKIKLRLLRGSKRNHDRNWSKSSLDKGFNASVYPTAAAMSNRLWGRRQESNESALFWPT